MKSILEVVAVKLSNPVMAATEGCAVMLVRVGRGVGGSDDGLSVTVVEGLCESLACEIGVEVRINWHLVYRWSSHEWEVELGVLLVFV